MTDKKSQYSAGIMAESSWFLEFKKVALLKNEGVSAEEIKKACIEENLFGLATQSRIMRTYLYIIRRVNSLDEAMLKLFSVSDLATQKLINFISIIQGDRLFFEFLYEVYRERILIGYDSIEAADINTFFRDKSLNCSNLASWKDTTCVKVRGCYLNFMADANLIRKEGKRYMLTPPILDTDLERYLMSQGKSIIIKAITGVK